MKPHIIILTLLASAFIPEVVYIFRLFTKKASNANLPKITLRVNVAVFLIACVLLAVAMIYDINYLNYKAPIDYSKWKEIKWSDFRAIKRPKQTLNGSENFAFICSEINVEFEGGLVKVNTLFHPARSYTFSEEVAGNNLLQHELYHLHITEYWSRIIRREVAAMENSSDKSGMIRLINDFKRKESDMQVQYDEVTYHGFILGEQRNWQRKIDSCLLSLEAYSNPIINYIK